MSLSTFFSRLRTWLLGDFYFGKPDLFLARQRKMQPALSASQEGERIKNALIQKKRDAIASKESVDRPTKLWKGF